MLPSSTVENYLKAIFLSQVRLAPDQLVPMGQLAASLHVAPGTATTMIKALAESGLVQYEPYNGVRLSSAGEKLAALVLRRHRLVELFLVEVMGMSWAEVHDEAEQLEHVVSNRLIERMDEMLGRPHVDPHGDPIPDPEGTIEHHEFPSLLTCPLNTPVTVSRVADQDPAFLRFVEDSHLKPGQQIEVEARDSIADSVRVRGRDDERITIGTRAASKLLVQVLQIIVVAAFIWPATSSPAGAQSAPLSSDRKFEILDNSFLVEEAFNQEGGVFQNIISFVGSDESDWEAVFTQEWPLWGQTHQFSYTLPFSGTSHAKGFDDLLINYRFQALTEGPGRPAFAPRLSLIVPSGNADEGRGSDVVGWQVNLPFSKQANDLYFHWNAGFTHLPGVDDDTGAASDVALTTPRLSASVIWRMRPMTNLMFESVAEFEEVQTAEGRTERENEFTLSPGLRTGWNIGDKQVIVGFAVPVGFNTSDEDSTTVAALLYFSYELPFAR